MTERIDPESLHDFDWKHHKGEDTFFENSPRYPFLANLVTALKPTCLFDLGCGSGFLGQLIKHQVPKIKMHGADISKVALQRAQAHFDQVWHLDIDHQKLPVADNFYDTVTCVEVLEHLYDPLHALIEISRILRPGGLGVVTVPNLAYWRYRIQLFRGEIPHPAADKRHLHQFNRQIFQEILSQAKFRLHRIVGFRERFLGLARWKPEISSDILIAVVEKDSI